MPGGIEAVKESLVKYLQSPRFSEHLAIVDADAVAEGRDDGTRATPQLSPESIFAYDRATLTSYPAVEVIGASTNYAADTDAVMRTHRLAVVFTVVGDDEAMVTRDVERLIEAAGRMFRGGVLDTRDGVRPIQIEIEDYSRLEPGPEGRAAFIKGGSLMLAIPTFTN